MKPSFKKDPNNKSSVDKKFFSQNGSANIPLKILVAEDNKLNYILINEMLAALGQSCQWVSNGQEAVTACAANDFDLIFMDCQMPIMDGYAATKEIRKMTPKKPPIPIVAMTAFAMEGDKEKCFAAGMDEYLSKPLKLGQIAAIIDKYSKDLK